MWKSKSKDIGIEVRNVRTLFFEATGMVVNVKKRYVSNASSSANDQGIQGLEEALSRGPDIIQSTFDRFSNVTGRDKFSKGDSKAFEQLEELSKKMKRDVLVPLQRQEKQGGNENFHALKRTVDHIQDSYVAEIGNLQFRLQKGPQAKEAPAVPEKHAGRSGFMKLGRRTSEQDTDESIKSSRTHSIASDIHSWNGYHPELHRNFPQTTFAEPMSAHVQHIGSMPAQPEATFDSYAPRYHPMPYGNFTHIPSSESPFAPGRYIGSMPSTSEATPGYYAPRYHPVPYGNFVQIPPSQPTSAHTRHLGPMPSSPESAPEFYAPRYQTEPYREFAQPYGAGSMPVNVLHPGAMYSSPELVSRSFGPGRHTEPYHNFLQTYTGPEFTTEQHLGGMLSGLESYGSGMSGSVNRKILTRTPSDTRPAPAIPRSPDTASSVSQSGSHVQYVGDHGYLHASKTAGLTSQDSTEYPSVALAELKLSAPIDYQESSWIAPSSPESPVVGAQSLDKSSSTLEKRTPKRRRGNSMARTAPSPVFAEKASVSAEYLGEQTNPFSSASRKEDEMTQSTQGKPSANSVEKEMVPRPLRPRATYRIIPGQSRRVSHSSSAMSSYVDSPLTPGSIGFPSREPQVHTASAPEVMRFPAPPSRTGSEARDETLDLSLLDQEPLKGSEVTTDPEFTKKGVLERLAQTSQPPTPQVLEGVRLASMKRMDVGMPVQSNLVHPGYGSTQPKTLKIDGSSSSIPSKWGLDEKKKRMMPLSQATGEKKALNICKGALNAQNGFIEKKKTWSVARRPAAMWDSAGAVRAYVKCEYCHFEGKCVQEKKKRSKEEWTDKGVYGSNGILYRWKFLYMSHMKLDKPVDHPVDSAFGCIFCTASNNDTPIFLGVASFLNHLQIHRKVSPPQVIASMVGAVIDRSPAVEEDFSIALPPLVI